MGNVHRGKRSAAIKRRLSNFIKSCRELERSEGGTTLESMICNFYQVIRETNGGQRGAAIEC